MLATEHYTQDNHTEWARRTISYVIMSVVISFEIVSTFIFSRQRQRPRPGKHQSSVHGYEEGLRKGTCENATV